MICKRNPDLYDYTEGLIYKEGHGEVLDWMDRHDPGRAYVVRVLTGHRETPKRIPDPDEHCYIQELSEGATVEPPREGSIESFTYPYGVDMDRYLFDLVDRMGPCHGEDITCEAMSLCCVVEEKGQQVVAFPEHFDIHLDLHRMVREGKLTTPDRDHMLDIPQPQMRDMETIRVVELFAGIGAFRKALRNLGIPHTAVMSEIDDFATMSYQAIHGETENLGDISKVERLPDCDLLTYGFPCQDISIAGKQAGFEEGSGTRSSLLWEVRRLLEGAEHLPKVLIMENVKNLVAKKNLPGFQRWIDWLTAKGYTSTWAVTNPEVFGVPQHRPRVIMVSILGDRSFDWSGMPTEATAKLRDGDYLNHVFERHSDSTNGEGIRKLTTEECFRLMGFTRRDAWRASRVCSDSQMYRQAGNSIVVPVLEWVFSELIRQGFWEVRT